MAKLINCKECGHQVSKTAKACPSCGAKMSRQRTSASTWMVAVIFGFVVFYSAYDMDRSPSGVSNRAAQRAQKDCEDTTAAFVMSQQFVKRQLKSPSTAEFPYTSSDGVRIEYQGECKHKVWAYVDAQNSFGATIRTNYYAEVRNNKGTDTWKALDIQLKER